MTRTFQITQSIRVYQALYNVSNYEMAVRMRMSEATWKRKKGNPEKFTCEELIRLEDKTKIKIFKEG